MATTSNGGSAMPSTSLGMMEPGPSGGSPDAPGGPPSRSFDSGDLIWAKMRGFPPWPAKVLSSESSTDMPNGRVSIQFFGTGETAFMKPSDCFIYFENRHQFEIPRKHKGFNEGVNEIRAAAGLPVEDMFRADNDNLLSPSTALRSHRSSNNSKLLTDVFLGLDRKRNRSISGLSKARSRASSSASLMKSLVRNMATKRSRNRLDSESSTGSRNRRGLLGSDLGASTNGLLDALDHLPFDGLGPSGLTGLPQLTGLSSLLGDDDERGSRGSRRSRGSSRVFEEYMLGLGAAAGLGTAGRMRTRSNSGLRSRLISGVSDVFEEIFGEGAAASSFSAEALMNALDNIPSEGSSTGGERARTPEAAANALLEAPIKFCSECGSECELFGVKWRCTGTHCLKWNGSHDPFASLSQRQDAGPSNSHQYPRERKALKINPDAPPAPNPPMRTGSRPSMTPSLPPESAQPSPRLRDEAPELILPSPTGRIKRKTVRISPPPPVRSPTRRGQIGRPPKFGRDPRYDDMPSSGSKVEKTPPVINGLRLCTNCEGQVRPQMCGGSRHRWRCVDKRCRKWYGWVKLNEETPGDTQKKSSTPLLPVKERIREEFDSSHHPPVEKKRVGRPPKSAGLKIKLGTKKEIEAARPKRKYTKRRDKETIAAAAAAAAAAGQERMSREDFVARPMSPLSEADAAYFPSSLERRSRWWTSEKRRGDYSPPRQFRADALDSAAVFRLLSQACRAAAVTRADEPGTVAGTMDLLMDTICASMAPLISLVREVPMLKKDRELAQMAQKTFDRTAVHTPIFQ